MSIFDIIGPVMVGPSSSHTAGAARIGYICRRIKGEPITFAQIDLYGSFLDTGKGHGTDRALVAGLLGMHEDDERIPDSFALAQKEGMQIAFGEAKLYDVNPNTVKLTLKGASQNELVVIGSSLGGGKIEICSIDGLETSFMGEYPTLIIQNLDAPGHVAKVVSSLGQSAVNIAAMKLYRLGPGEKAVMVIECDQDVPAEVVACLRDLDGVFKVTYLNLDGEVKR